MDKEAPPCSSREAIDHGVVPVGRLDLLPVTFAVNSLNRSMGIDDLYPFVIWLEAVEKLKAVHQAVRSSTKGRQNN